MELVNLDQAKVHLRVDHDEDDDDIQQKIEAASAAVVTYLKSGADSFVDTSGAVVADVPQDVQFATLLLVGHFYKNREAQGDSPVPAAYGYGYLPLGVTALLYPYRTPTLA